MASHVAFLRGINVSNRRVTSAGLCAPFGSAGLDGATAFRASGNVVFDASREARGKLESRISKALGEALGFEVDAFVRTAAEVRAIAGAEPFTAAQVASSEGKPQVWFLGRKPGAVATKKVLALATSEDRLALDGRELYWLPSAGTQESDLDWKAIDAALGVGTMRTIGTVEQIAAKFFS